MQGREIASLEVFSVSIKGLLSRKVGTTPLYRVGHGGGTTDKNPKLPGIAVVTSNLTKHLQDTDCLFYSNSKRVVTISEVLNVFLTFFGQR